MSSGDPDAGATSVEDSPAGSGGSAGATPANPPDPPNPPDPGRYDGSAATEAALGGVGNWQRLNWRMLLAYPVVYFGQLLLPVSAVAIFRGSFGDYSYWLVLAALTIVGGAARYFSTKFRATGGQIEVRSGIFVRKTQVARLDLVRTVDVTSTLAHRLFGITRATISTGAGAGGNVVLDGVTRQQSRLLREALLRRSSASSDPVSADTPAAPGSTPPPGAVASWPLLRLDSRWLRYAPLTTSGWVTTIAALGGLFQLVGSAPGTWFAAHDIGARLDRLPLWLTVPTALIAFGIILVALSLVGYLLANHQFSVRLDVDRSNLHIRRGLLTTNETSLEVARVRGVVLREQLLLRYAGAGQLFVISTGGGPFGGSTTAVGPPAPRQVSITLAAQLLQDPAPLSVPLLSHGPRATRRRFTRALVIPGVVAAALAASLALWGHSPWWNLPSVVLLAALVPLAANRAKRLGHALTERYMVSSSGSLWAHRDVLLRDGIIGWKITQTPFQRLARLATATASTAAGDGSYSVVDLPVEQATAFADAATPGLLAPFLQHA